MGLFDIFKSKSEVVPTPPEKKVVSVDDIYLITVPAEWNQFESDRFRMRNDSETIQFTVSNYAKGNVNAEFSVEDLKTLMIPLLEDFVTGGGYESLNDREIGKNYISQSFKVDEETQYYFYTWRNVRQSQFVISHFVIRAIGPFDQRLKDELNAIGNSVIHKISYK